MFANLTVDTAALLQRVFYECPCKYVPLDELKDQWAKKLFNMRALKNPVAPSATAAHHAAQNRLRKRAQNAPQTKFALESKWPTILEQDKRFHAARLLETSLQDP
jgi:hypothetical protein